MFNNSTIALWPHSSCSISRLLSCEYRSARGIIKIKPCQSISTDTQFHYDFALLTLNEQPSCEPDVCDLNKQHVMMQSRVTLKGPALVGTLMPEDLEHHHMSPS